MAANIVHLHYYSIPYSPIRKVASIDEIGASIFRMLELLTMHEAQQIVQSGGFVHEVGKIPIKTNYPALDRAVRGYLEQYIHSEMRRLKDRQGLLAFSDENYLFLEYEEYIKFCKDQGIEHPATRLFQTFYDKGEFPPNRKGWLRYLQQIAPNTFRDNMFEKSARFLLSEQERTDLLNTYITAQSDSGKSRLCQRMVYLTAKAGNAAVIVIDPAGDLAEKLKFKEFKDRLVYIEPFLFPDRTPTVNVFECPGPFPTKRHERVAKARLQQEIRGILDQMLGMGKELTSGMSLALNRSIRVLLDIEGADFTALVKLLRLDPTWWRKTLDTDYAEFFRTTFVHDTQLEKSRTAVATRLEDILESFEAFRDLTSGKSTLNLTELIDQKKIIVFNLAEGIIGEDTTQNFAKLVAANLLSLALRRAEIKDENKRTETYFFLDEAQLFLTKSLWKAISQARKYKFRQIIIQPGAFIGMEKEQIELFKTNVRLRFVGKFSPDVPKMAYVLDPDQKEITPQVLDELEKGEFFVQRGSKPLIRIYAPLLEGVEMDDVEFTEYAETIKKYYRLLEEPKPPDKVTTPQKDPPKGGKKYGRKPRPDT